MAMEQLGPRMGRAPEDIADEIMNQSDESLDDLIGTEVYEGDDAVEDYEDGESPADYQELDFEE